MSLYDPKRLLFGCDLVSQQDKRAVVSGNNRANDKLFLRVSPHRICLFYPAGAAPLTKGSLAQELAAVSQ